MNTPFYETLLLDIGFVVLLLAAGAIIYFFIQRIWDIFRKKTKYENEGCFGFLLKFLLLIFLLLLSLSFIGFAVLVQTFQGFSDLELVAEVTCEKVDNDVLRFIITQKYGTKDGKTDTLSLKGDKWFIKGDIIKWKNQGSFWDFPNWYRITEVGAYYQRNVGKKLRKKASYYLLKKKIPITWNWLYNVGKKMPLSYGLYGKMISETPDSTKKYKIYVTTTGFFIKSVDRDLSNEQKNK